MEYTHILWYMHTLSLHDRLVKQLTLSMSVMQVLSTDWFLHTKMSMTNCVTAVEGVTL